MQWKKLTNIWLLFLFWLWVCVLGRVIPHPYNATPLTSLALFSAFFFQRRYAGLVTLSCLLISDAAVAFVYGYAFMGSWSVFTYSGFLLIALLASLRQRLPNYTRSMIYTVLAACGYWIWTNFGTWLISDSLYPHTLIGLQACYVAGLPFLRHAILGALIWSTAIYWVATRCFTRAGLRAVPHG